MPAVLRGIFAALLSASLLAGCIPAVPVVSDFNGSSVKLQISTLANADEAKARSAAEAARICARVNKRAEYASTRQIQDYTYEHLYLCL